MCSDSLACIVQHSTVFISDSALSMWARLAAALAPLQPRATPVAAAHRRNNHGAEAPTATSYLLASEPHKQCVTEEGSRCRQVEAVQPGCVRAVLHAQPGAHLQRAGRQGSA